MKPMQPGGGSSRAAKMMKMLKGSIGLFQTPLPAASQPSKLASKPATTPECTNVQSSSPARRNVGTAPALTPKSKVGEWLQDVAEADKAPKVDSPIEDPCKNVPAKQYQIWKARNRNEKQNSLGCFSSPGGSGRKAASNADHTYSPNFSNRSHRSSISSHSETRVKRKLYTDVDKSPKTSVVKANKPININYSGTRYQTPLYPMDLQNKTRRKLCLDSYNSPSNSPDASSSKDATSLCGSIHCPSISNSMEMGTKRKSSDLETSPAPSSLRSINKEGDEQPKGKNHSSPLPMRLRKPTTKIQYTDVSPSKLSNSSKESLTATTPQRKREPWQIQLENIDASPSNSSSIYQPSGSGSSSEASPAKRRKQASLEANKQQSVEPAPLEANERLSDEPVPRDSEPENLTDEENEADQEKYENRRLSRRKTQRSGGVSKAKRRRKEARSRGEAYLTAKGKLVPSRDEPLPLLGCKKNCNQRISQDVAASINKDFYELADYNQKSKVLASYITIQKKKTARMSGLKKKNREVTHFYHLTVRGENIPVCKKCFTNVLRVSNKAIEIAAAKKLKKVSGIIETDQRGSSIPGNILSDTAVQEIVDHINSFPVYESHYSRKKTEKKFLPSHLDLSTMYRLYCDVSAKPVSRWSYDREFHRLGLSFKPPKVDTCKTCDELATAITLCKTEQEKEKLKKKQELHHRKAEKAFASKAADNEEASKEEELFRVATFDLQQCLPTPHISTSVVFYKRQLWTYNLTFHDCHSTNSTNYMWHEGIAGRGANQIGSALVDYILALPSSVKKITFYSDTCGGQNKNTIVVAALLYALKKKTSLDEIHHKFLLSGHTHMECDSDHSVIEKKKKKAKDLHLPRDYYNLVRNCGSRFQVVVMDRSKQLDFKALLDKGGPIMKRKKNINGNTFDWRPIVWLKYSKSVPLGVVEYKTTLEKSAEFDRIDLRRDKKCMDLRVGKAYKGPNPINPLKKKDLMDLLQFLDPECHDFYQKLVTSDDVKNSDPDLCSSDEDLDAD